MVDERLNATLRPLPVWDYGREWIEKCHITSIDNAALPSYFGFLNEEGGWYIMKLTGTEVTYIKGDSGYAANWAGRAGLAYDYFDVIF